MRYRNEIALAVVAALWLLGGAARAEGLPDPPDVTTWWETEFFGDARNVQLLADLLARDDARVREQAAKELGETCNRQALPHLQKAMTDPDAGVREAAVTTMSHFPQLASSAVATGLKDPAPEVKFAALRLARQCRLTVGGEVKPLLASDDATLQADALYTLTELSVAAEGKTLAALLNSRSLAVRMQAARNAALVVGEAQVLAVEDDLSRVASADDPAVRCEALRALAKLDFDGAKTLLEACALDKSPLVRLGVVRGYALAGQVARIGPFLDDPSEMVRLAAIRGVASPAGAGNARKLFEAMLKAPLGEVLSMDSHRAARDSLIALNSDDVPRLAADKLPEVVRDYLDVPRLLKQVIKEYRESKLPPDKMPDFTKVNQALMDKEATYARNIRACCRLLGAYRSPLALDREIELVKSQPTDSPLLADLAWSLGRIGDAKAVAPLEALLAKYVKLGHEYLSSIGMQPPPHIPYNDPAAAEVVYTLTELKDGAATDNILALATMKVMDFRLDKPVIAAMRCLPRLQTPANAAKIEAVFEDLIRVKLRSPQMDLLRYNAIREAGLQGRTQALPAIREALQQRPGRKLIDLAAWAIWKLSGQMPEVPDPLAMQSPNWIVQTRSK